MCVHVWNSLKLINKWLVKKYLRNFIWKKQFKRYLLVLLHFFFSYKQNNLEITQRNEDNKVLLLC